MSDDNLVTSDWAPGLIGLAVSALLYGTALGQSIFYARSFPNDFNAIKLMVLLIFFADTVHLIGSSQYFWYLLISCHRSNSWSCETELSWEHCHRSHELHHYVRRTMFLLSSSMDHQRERQAGYCGYLCHSDWATRSWCMVFCRDHSTWNYQFSLLDSARTVRGSCEHFVRYLHHRRCLQVFVDVRTSETGQLYSTSGNHLYQHGCSHLVRLTLSAAVFADYFVCSLISVTVGVVYLAQGHHYWVGTAAIVMSRCYVNSFLAVLNARRSIREREMRRLRYTVELPTLSTIV
ncbi:hypothetical protein PAXINDRAFT_95834 [Paxillus involutus ATCC 200175]|nr:hypothetical protein PAXINDRAFT_95834 [Paxillus involutus ATCC 200175]